MTTKTNRARGLAREAAQLQYRFEGSTYLYLAERERRRWLTPEEHECVLALAIAKAVRV